MVVDNYFSLTGGVLMKYAAVAIGGFFGAISRLGISQAIPASHGFPFGTMAANMAGCLFLGWFSAYMAGRAKSRPQLVLLIGTGFTGSFTTFSTFSVETLRMVQDGEAGLAVFYAALSILLGIGLALLGTRIAVQKKATV